MSRLTDKIDINLVEEEIVDIEEIKCKLNERIIKNDILRRESKTETSDATFDSDIWIIDKPLTQGYINLNMTFLSDLKTFKRITDKEITAFRCFFAEKILNKYNTSIGSELSVIRDCIMVTNNFDLETIDSTYGNPINQLLDAYSGKTKSDKINSILEYLYYLDELDILTEGENKAIETLMTMDISRQDNARELPKEKDIMAFDYYLKRFYKDESFSEDMKMLYMPILIWWKITTVIPMRPSELCSKLTRECLIEEDEKYYIYVNRIKSGDASNKGVVRKGRIPLLNKIQITKEIYDLINDYIEKTNEYGHTETLFSYKALCAFRKKIAIEFGEEYGYITIPIEQKIDEEYFSINVLGPMLKGFYKRIISNTYKYEVERQLNIGDTRHIAFTSLLLQGVSPIEIAMLGGHTSLSSQDHYQGNSSFYADSEMIDFVSSKMHRRSISTKALKDIIFNKEKSEEAPRNLEQCIQTEDGVGYCTIDIDNDILACGDEEFCIGCKHWWCPKTQESFIEVQEYLENNIASSLHVKIQREKVFLQKLLSKPKTKQLNGVLDLDNDYEYKLKTSINKLNRELSRRSDVEGILQINSGLNLSDVNQDTKLFLEGEV